MAGAWLGQSALESIPAESKYAEMVRDMLRWYAEMPQDWKAAWRKTVDKWQAKENIGRVSTPNIDVKINGAMVLLGYLWGEGDPDRTMRISTAGGFGGGLADLMFLVYTTSQCIYQLVYG